MLAWINARLPDPEEQKALRQALDKAYPPSKWRTVTSTVVLGASSWLVLTHESLQISIMIGSDAERWENCSEAMRNT